MKFLISTLLTAIVLSNANALTQKFIELTPANLKENGISLTLKAETNKDSCDYIISITVLPPKLLFHHSVSLEVRDHDKFIASCQIKPFLEDDNVPLFYNFQIAEKYISESKIWLFEDTHTNNGKRFWFSLQTFNTAEQGAAANP